MEVMGTELEPEMDSSSVPFRLVNLSLPYREATYFS